MFKQGLKVSLAALALLSGVHANAEVVYYDGFEDETSGWMDSDNDWYGSVDRVASGTNGISAFEGGWYAMFTQSEGTGPFTRFDGYRDSFSSLSTRTAVYLDTDWASGEGFDYSVAANNTDGGHLRDFIFHVTKDSSTGDLLVGGSNNTNFDPREDLENLNHYTVMESGWFVFEHLFRDEGGTLAVDLNLWDAMGNLVFTETRNNASDTIPEVAGGNRYGWFTNIDIAGGIAVDATSLSVPEPAALSIFALGLLGAARLRRKA